MYSHEQEGISPFLPQTVSKHAVLAIELASVRNITHFLLINYRVFLGS